ncbi:fasciclin-3-like isoform X4 [Wyeomyia smithii]|nr:fasciclin-3-like isoform X4 [Wyeomyia smithii]XP_055530597.1 fasciclin-3-like isoform X4 [Wyeomyia smithii]XP_055530598.1 fasciclin-3-like isoform X4 [Wyeomyia smithii]
MVDKQRTFLTYFVVCLTLSAINGQHIQVNTDPARVVVIENQRNVSLMCRVGRPIQICTVTLPNRDQQVLLDPNAPPRDGLQYFGPGFNAGVCGVTIDRISTAHNGQLKCSLFIDGVSAESYIDVVVAVAPTNPKIETYPERVSFEVDSKLMAKCITENGNPGAVLAWYLEDEPLFQGVGRPQETQEADQPGVTNILTLERSIQASDSGKRLICEAKHIAYPERVSKTSRQITVNFAPQALPETTVHGLTLGRTVDVTITIRSNPLPHAYWSVDGVEIEQGMESGRLSARIPEPLGNDSYNMTLTIAGLTLEDLSKTYFLRAVNQVGTQDYTIMLSSMEAEVDESGGVGIGGIIGIVLAALIILTAVALIIVARATGRWCFRGKSISTSASNARIGETDRTDNSGAGEQLLSTTTVDTPSATLIFVNTSPASFSPESGIYSDSDCKNKNTTIPVMLRPKNFRNPDLLQSTFERDPQISIHSSIYDGSSIYSTESGGGDPDQIGLPPSNRNRWIPLQQRDLLERQANLLVAGANIRRKRETEIF